MKIKLTKTESEQFFHTALCNGLGYLGGYNLRMSFIDEQYEEAKTKILKKTTDTDVCYEDVLLGILKGGGELALIDSEGDYNSTITIVDVHDNMSLVDAEFLIDMQNENDDAETADVILQTVFYK